MIYYVYRAADIWFHYTENSKEYIQLYLNVIYEEYELEYSTSILVQATSISRCIITASPSENHDVFFDSWVIVVISKMCVPKICDLTYVTL